MSDQYPSAPQPVGAAPEGAETTGAAPAKKKNPLLRFIIPVVVLIALAVGGWWFNRDNVENAKVGDCVANLPTSEGVSDLKGAKIVKCDDAGAEAKVIGTVEGKTYADFEAAEVEVLCSAHPTTTYAIFFGKSDSNTAKGQILCLEDAK